MIQLQAHSKISKFIFPVRLVGFLSGALSLVPQLLNGGHWVAWCYLIVCAIGWPLLAKYLAINHPKQHRAERKNLLGDAIVVGSWLPIAQFNPLTTTLFIAMGCMGAVGVGGLANLYRPLVMIAISAGVTSALIHPTLTSEVSSASVFAAIPLITFFPLMVGISTNELAKQLYRQHQRLVIISQTDDLSGLSTRRHWDSCANTLIEHYQRQRAEAAILLMDIDHFKSINDQYGHAVGDQVIIQVSNILRQSMRSTDVAGRYGGEEFALLLPNTNLQGAQHLAEQILQQVGSTTIWGELELRCTLSIGIAMLPATDADLQRWMRQADIAMYQAKELGRNQIISWHPELEQPQLKLALSK